MQNNMKLKTISQIPVMLFPVLCILLALGSIFDIEVINQTLYILINVIFYTFALAYLLSFYFFKTSIIGIIGVFICYPSFLFAGMEFSWIIAICLLPSLYVAFFKRGKKNLGIVLTSIVAGCILAFVPLHLIFKDFGSLEKTYHISPDSQYAAVECINDQGALGGREYVVLYKNYSSCVIVRLNEIYKYQGQWKGDLEVRWLDNNTIQIEDSIIGIGKYR